MHCLRFLVLFSFILSVIVISAAQANDSSAEVTPNGISLTKQNGVVLESEDLFISKKKVQVAYLFRNVTDKDIVTEVAFPIPPYDLDYPIPGIGPEFDDFVVEMDGRITPYQIETKGLANGKDVITAANKYINNHLFVL